MTEQDIEELKQAIVARRALAIDLLRSFVAVPSVTGAEGAVQDVIQLAFSERELDIDRWEATAEQIAGYEDHVGFQETFAGRPNLAATRTGTGGGRSILLNAHIDTVENGERSTWTRDPNAGELVGDLLYGRGSCDMKGGLVTFLLALDALDALGVRLKGDVTS